jgi:hypothetical protein
MRSLCGPSRLPVQRLAMTALIVAGVVSVPAMAQPANNAEVYSSSASSNSFFNMNDLVGNELAPAPDPAPSPRPAGQSWGNNRYPAYPYHNPWSHLAIEAGGGFTAPVGNDVSGGKGEGLSGYDTWGYNLTAGAGWNFTKRLGLLAEYRFNRNKIPGATLATLGAPGGNVNTYSFTLDPIFYLPVTKRTGAYVTGGGGLYRKVTNYTAPELGFGGYGGYGGYGYGCYYGCFGGYGYYNQTIYHFSSNQGGVNLGVGYYWKLGEDTNAKLYAEARYEWIDSPGPSARQPLSEGTEELIPVTFGIRF